MERGLLIENGGLIAAPFLDPCINALNFATNDNNLKL